METLSDENALRERVVSIFERMKFAGFDASVLELSAEAGSVTLEFQVSDSWANPFGFLHGGIVATMLDSCLGMAGSIKSGGNLAMPLAEMKISFVRPVMPGKVLGKGETVRLGKGLAFLEATLLGASGDALARASATASPIPWPTGRA